MRSTSRSRRRRTTWTGPSVERRLGNVAAGDPPLASYCGDFETRATVTRGLPSRDRSTGSSASITPISDERCITLNGRRNESQKTCPPTGDAATISSKTQVSSSTCRTSCSHSRRSRLAIPRVEVSPFAHRHTNVSGHANSENDRPVEDANVRFRRGRKTRRRLWRQRTTRVRWYP